MIFLKKIQENMIFSVYPVKTAFIFPTNMILPFCQKKKKKGLLPKKYTKRFLSQKNSNDSMYFYGELYRRFHTSLSK